MDKKCCKCEEHEWEDPQDVVWEDPADGKAYCVFHAPKAGKLSAVGGSELSQGEFTRRVDGRIRRCRGKGSCNLSGTIFPYDISFSVFRGTEYLSETKFSHCRFIGVATFASTIFKGNAYFDQAHFGKDVVFWRTEFLKGCDFSGTKFHKKAYFYITKFEAEAIFKYIESKDKAIQIIGTFEKHLENINFGAIEIDHFRFQSIERWPKRMGAEKYAQFRFDVVASQEFYRAMKKAASEEHDQPSVSHWHFREKLMQLKQLFNNERSNNLIEVVEDRDAKWLARAWAWFQLLILPPSKPKLSLTGIYWATSGFGERAVRAGVWLLALVALSFLANSIKEPWVWAELPGSAAAGYTMATIPFAKDIPGDGWVKVGRGFWQLLIAVQFTLFALAVRNRFRR